MSDPALFGPTLSGPTLPDLTPDPPSAPLVLDAPDGPHPLGAPSVDSDADGLADTVLGPAPGGGDGDPDLLLATDVDHDGHVDVATVLGAGGSATTSRRGPDGTLPPPPAPGPEPPGWEPGWEPGWDAAAPPAPSIDPATGAWTRMP